MRAGRFEVKIRIERPNTAGRFDILKARRQAPLCGCCPNRCGNGVVVPPFCAACLIDGSSLFNPHLPARRVVLPTGAVCSMALHGAEAPLQQGMPNANGPSFCISNEFQLSALTGAVIHFTLQAYSGHT